RRSSESKNGEPRIGGRRRRERQEHGKREPEAKHQAITRPPPVSIGKGKTGKRSRRETGRLRKGTDDPMEAPFVRLREQCVVGRTDQREDVASSGQLAREIEESEAGGQNREKDESVLDLVPPGRAEKENAQGKGRQAVQQ